MKLHLLPIIVFTSLILSSCGGASSDGATTSSTPTPSSTSSSLALSSSSSSAKSSVSAELGCSYHKSAVYVDAVCSPWQSPSIREQNADGSPGQEMDAKQSQIVSLVESETQEPAHQRVIDIHYNKPGAANSQLRFRIAEGTNSLDLSDYLTGKLVFDIKVISWGDKNAPLQVTLDCGWPCESTEKNIAVSSLNEWNTVELLITDFIRDGLDIKRVHSGFQIMPGLNRQTNVHFQLDNIRWEKGPSSQPVSEACYSHHFDSTTPTGLSIRSFSGDKLPTLVGQVPASIIKPEWSSPQERWGYGEQTLNQDERCLSNPDSTFSASVYIPGAYVTDGKLLVGFYFADADSKYTTAGLTSAANLVPDSWNVIQGKFPHPQSITRRVSAKLAASNAAFAHWGILFDANGKDPAITGEVRIDNIVILQNLSVSSSSVNQNTSSANTSSVAVSSSTSISQSSNSVITSSLSSVGVISSSSSSSQGSSQASVVPSSASTISSSSAAATSSSSQASVATSSTSSSIVAISSVASSSLSNASSSAGCSATSGSHATSGTLEFGATTGSVRFLRIELSNGKFASLPGVSIPNTRMNVVQSNDSMVVLQVEMLDNLSSSTPVDVSLDYQQISAQQKVSRSIAFYETATYAMNAANALSYSSVDIASSACP